MYKLVFYVPDTHCERVKQAIFDAGAGKQGHYMNCSWQVLGQGQFMPLKGSQPFMGLECRHETVSEYRVETQCDHSVIQQVIEALKQSHPYEEPAYDIWRTEDF